MKFTVDNHNMHFHKSIHLFQVSISSKSTSIPFFNQNVYIITIILHLHEFRKDCPSDYVLFVDIPTLFRRLSPLAYFKSAKSYP